MIDDASDIPPGEDLPTEGDATPPPASTAQVVSLKAAAKARKGTPDASAGANASDAGAGGDKAGGKPQKPEKTIDWGVYNHLLENFALIYGTDTVWDGGQRLIMKLANMAHAHGSDLVKMWKGSPKRRTVLQQNVVFDPTGKADPEICVNLYDGIALVPRKGPVGPILDLIRYLTSRAAEDAEDCDHIMHWLLQWLAYPLQHPGAKLRTAIVMHGDEGAGKNFLFDLVASIYGKYGCLVGQDELEDKFNDWRSCKCFVVGDEVSSRQELVHNKNRLKALITSPTVQINPKNLPRREEANHMNVVFLSNEITPLALDNSDRRYLVIYTPRAKDFTYYRALGVWRDSGGVAAFYDFLLEYPLDGFDPYAPAPVTTAKKELIDINRKSPELFWLAWKDGEIDLPYRSCAVAQAYRGYLKWCQRTGDRFPFKQGMFTRTLLRMAESHDPPAREKVMKLTDPSQPNRCMRMLLVTEPPSDAQGAWAADCFSAFEHDLRKFCGDFPRSPGDGASGDEG